MPAESLRRINKRSLFSIEEDDESDPFDVTHRVVKKHQRRDSILDNWRDETPSSDQDKLYIRGEEFSRSKECH